MRAVLAVLLALSTALAGCTTSDGGNGDDGSGGGDTVAKVCTSSLDANVTAEEVTWVLNTSMGVIRLTLFCDKTPVTAQNMVNLTESGYFDGTKFHRVIENFMNQGGDPNTKNDSLQSQWGTGGPGYRIRDEFYCADGTVDHKMDDPQYPDPRFPTRYEACGGDLGLKHDAAGVLSMANSGPNSGSSQFFITATATPHLDGAHPVFGKTADQGSLDVVLAINRVETTGPPSDRPLTPVVLEKATIEWP